MAHSDSHEAGSSLPRDNPEDGAAAEESRKRKSPPQKTEGAPSKKSKPAKEKENSAIYVTQLPLWATQKDISEEFSRFGVIAVSDADPDNPRIKMYSDDEGNFKGEALIVYAHPLAVNQAIMLADKSNFMYKQANNECIRVQAADSNYKKTKTAPTADANASEPVEKKPAKSAYQVKKDRENWQRNKDYVQRQLGDWGDEDPSADPKPLPEIPRSKTVVFRNMFRIYELEEDAEAANEICDFVRETCQDFGAVKKVVLYEQEPEGVVTARFASEEDAEKCVGAVDGRSSEGRVVKAYLWDGKEKFRGGFKAVAKKVEGEEEELERIEAFAKELEEDEGEDAEAGKEK